ncbi:XdhC family protein [Arthrobacter jiangjiafuii]|uniref:XdhC family protein n=1 Tax=Arthrobacter jiangjiafuii TaxID=2817475 RepID=A0A975R2B5_9MICC|nr:XdhC family protein [Arthrobacter jiangjiafuii]MBP3044415.1 XdhC family protein [Arthrobacter jiangjiafuii]QWC11359.1 XdhC family protein [Arthrobacter jiangjiafuii]
MNDLPADLAQRALAHEARNEPYVRATVVRAERPASARAGDTALLDADGTLHGFVGGHCVQGSVRDYGLQTLASGEPLLLRVLPGAPSRTAGEGAVEVSNPCLSGGAIEIFLQPQLPAPHLLVFGDTPVARALRALGACLDLDVELADGSAASPAAGDAAVIVASHGEDEEPALAAALAAGVPYIALVASAKRAAAVLASLDVDDDARQRIHSPAGLPLGARTPAETALSILAEFTALRAQARDEGTESTESTDHAEPADQALAGSTQAVDPVCGMHVTVAAGTLQATAGGVVTYFCSPSCRLAFVAEPDRYAALS